MQISEYLYVCDVIGLYVSSLVHAKPVADDNARTKSLHSSWLYSYKVHEISQSVFQFNKLCFCILKKLEDIWTLFVKSNSENL